jgi:hypothetical protein
LLILAAVFESVEINNAKELSIAHYCKKLGYLKQIRKGTPVRRPWRVAAVFQITEAGRERLKVLQGDKRV